jgi:hypothetical protein
MSDSVEDMDIPIKDSDKYLKEFNKGNYVTCRKILEQMLAPDRKTQELDKNRTLKDCILKNNVVVCKALVSIFVEYHKHIKILKYI